MVRINNVGAQSLSASHLPPMIKRTDIDNSYYLKENNVSVRFEKVLNSQIFIDM